MSKDREDLVNRLANRMREDASTGLSNRLLNQINFRSLAVSVVLELNLDRDCEVGKS